MTNLSRKAIYLAVALTVASLLVFTSCNGGGGGSGGTTKPSTVTETFYAQNVKTRQPYTLRADRLYEGTYCTVWAERGSGVTEDDAKILAREYDRNIYTSMNNMFGNSFRDGSQTFANTMILADYLGDRDGKLCILMLDIKGDGYSKPGDPYIAGYFWPGDFYPVSEVRGSNQRDMIYVDTNPGFKNDRETVYSTLAHEMQHMMNFVTSVALRTDIMDTWIDEGLSSAAEWMYLGRRHTEDRAQYFNGIPGTTFKGDPSGLIAKGNNFFVWDNPEYQSNNMAIMDEYNTVYLFFQWLRIQSDDGEGIYKKIISSPYADYQAITSTAHSSDWPTLLGDWYAANYINHASNRQGYKNEAVLRDVRFPLAAASSSKTISLYPGEGVLSSAKTYTVPAQSAYIKYKGLTKTGLPFDSGEITEGALLTYNVNTNSNPDTAVATAGTITGVAASNTLMKTVMSFSDLASFNFPMRIGARDILRRNGHTNELSVMELKLSLKEAEGEE